MRPRTLALVRSLDLRGFVAGAADFSLYYCSTTLSKALRLLPSAFPRLACILLDGHADVEPEALASPPGDVSSLAAPDAAERERPLLLSMPHCQAKLPASFFASPYLRSLVYMDVSDMPGSLKTPLVQRTLSPANLPGLRILKARGREMDNGTATLLFETFKEQLWSVDLSRNKLSDGALDDMLYFSFPAVSSRRDNFAVEGRLTYPPGEGSPSFGKFCFVDESEWSASFSHPLRHLADAPSYAAHAHAQDGPQGGASPRLDGRVRIRPDSADAVKAMLSGGLGRHGPSPEQIHELDICRGHQGITHLYLNGNNISAAALASMIRSSPGQLQRLECDTMSFKVHEAARPSWLPANARLSGILGWAHVFRPVFSANLQVLRIHHSLVTQLPSLEVDNLPAMECLWLAETCLLPRAELAYPEAFVPDMNPRLQSLTLTRIPRYSRGPLIEKLISFLRLASLQERVIQDIRAANRRGPATLPGLRHIRLEFEPDPREATLVDEPCAEDVLDAAGLLDSRGDDFSFFRDSGWAPSPSPSNSATTAGKTRPIVRSESELRGKSSSSSSSNNNNNEPDRLNHSPLQPTATEEADDDDDDDDDDQPPSEYVTHTWSWPQNSSSNPSTSTVSVPVWTGPRRPARAGTIPPAVREYARLLRANNPSSSLRADPVPASPNHVAAGVPHGTYIFSAAWDAIATTTTTTTTTASSSSRTGTGMGTGTGVPPRPTRAELLAGMRDVLAAVKAYRAQTRTAYRATAAAAAGKDKGKGKEVPLGGPHFHWTGRLEVALAESAAGSYHPSKYWR